MDREHRKYFIIVKMFSLFLYIVTIMESFSHTSLNLQVKIMELEKASDLMLTYVGIWLRNLKELNMREKKLVEINSMHMHFQD